MTSLSSFFWSASTIFIRRRATRSKRNGNYPKRSMFWSQHFYLFFKNSPRTLSQSGARAILIRSALESSDPATRRNLSIWDRFRRSSRIIRKSSSNEPPSKVPRARLSRAFRINVLRQTLERMKVGNLNFVQTNTQPKCLHAFAEMRTNHCLTFSCLFFKSWTESEEQKRCKQKRTKEKLVYLSCCNKF